MAGYAIRLSLRPSVRMTDLIAVVLAAGLIEQDHCVALAHAFSLPAFLLFAS